MDIILYEPAISGNIGAVARVMKNFDFKTLILVDPKCEVDEEAKRRAKHAQDVLRRIEIKDKNSLKKYDYLIATTAKLGSSYNILRLPLLPSQLAEKIMSTKVKAGIKATKVKSKIGLLFGPEGTGLSNELLAKADFVITIPAGQYRTLNLSHAVAIILYELFKAKVKESKESYHKPAGAKEKEKFFAMLDDVLDGLDFVTKEKKETQKAVWRRMIGKAMLTRRELFALFGFLKKLKLASC
ncbi:hypothetical protein DRJ17_01850 [Candidatus Woesearchaeota archaeon]|nr:MAG: hypothetical protein DRJ17_01850 [Candidatus Woesearchaeota archaeon]